MCGIAGIVPRLGDSQDYEGRLKKMMKVLTHRGPDGEGLHLFRSCAFGHLRLSIVDLKTGEQPMFSPDGHVGIVFNGEVYGYREIKQKLTDYQFRTASDTEVILALYEKYGEDFLNNLPGMFSLAIWDDRKQKLICGRDRFGEKPFYYAWGPKGEFIFGSELKAILASGLVNPELDPAMVAFFLKHLYVQPDHTIYRNVFTLSPGHRLVLHNGEAKIDRYWSMPASDQSISLTEAVEGFRRLLTQAVRRQFVADVPVGVFLSGGLDSSTIVAVARDYVQDLNTFSFGFRDNGTNEMHFAGEVARLFRTNHHQLYEGDHEPLSDLLLKMQEVYDEPSADSANVPTYLISRLARQYVKVVLTGEGADELLGGYVAYRPFVYANSLPFPRALKGFFRHAADDLKKRGIGRDSKLYQVIFGGFYKTNFRDLRQAHFLRTKAFNEIEMAALGLPNMPELDFYKPSWPLSGTIEDVLRVDLENFLPGDINVKSDRASMAHGLELRLPFLDMDLASFCLSLPSRFKVDRHTDKIILRWSFENKWPPALRQRPKHGFVAPIKRWLTTDASVRSLVDAYLNDPNKRLFNLIPFSAVRPMIRANDYRTWALLELSLWLESRPVYN